MMIAASQEQRAAAMIDTFYIRHTGEHWCVQDGTYLYPCASREEAVEQAVSLAKQSDYLGRCAKAVIAEVSDGENLVWQSRHLELGTPNTRAGSV